MILPKYIYDVLNSPIGFDLLLAQKIKETDGGELWRKEAYYAAVEEVQQYIPNFKEPYNSEESYKVKVHTERTKEMFLPDDIVDACINGIWKIYEEKLLRKKVKKMAYDATMEYINKYLPNFQPYRNYNSFRNALIYKDKRAHKKEVYAKKRKKG